MAWCGTRPQWCVASASVCGRRPRRSRGGCNGFSVVCANFGRLSTRVEQTSARVLGGDTHVVDKVLSVFEPHTEAIRKGKHVKPTEFGKLVTIQEAEHQIITAY